VQPEWPIETERLTLRPFAEADFDAFYEIHSNVEVARWLYHDARTEAETREHLARKIAATAWSGEADWLSCAVLVRETGDLVGDIGMNWLSVEHKTGEIGFLFNPRFQGNGYATEAAGALVSWGFDGAGLHRVIGRTEARNVASARVLEKLGMRREGHLVENEWVKGEWQSELVYAILEREWR
jgi:RimJ/RimL family protein N-acetyltransferase